MTEVILKQTKTVINLPLVPPYRKPSLMARQFGLLIRQSVLDLPIQRLLHNFPQFQNWLEQVRENASEIWTIAEHQRVTNVPTHYYYSGYCLSTTYPLLLVNSEGVQIYYWTTANPVSWEKISQDWHTQLDLFLLVKNFNYVPEQASLIYWFLTQFQVVQVSLKYSSNLHQEFEYNLTKVLQEDSLPIPPRGDLTTLLLNRQISVQYYLDAIPEIEIEK